MLLYVVLFILTAHSFSALPSRKPVTKTNRRSPQLADRTTQLTAQAATRQKFRNAPTLLRQGTSPGYAIPPSLQDTYNHASDYATTPPDSRPNPSANLPSNASFPPTIIVSLLDDTDNVDDFEYYGSLGFGSQAQPLGIDFDTGSADLWVPISSSCETVTSFQANASTTYHNTGQNFQVTYGEGYINGTLAQDTVQVGSLQVHNQFFGVADQLSPNFCQSPSDGLVGLAFSSIANSHKLTLFENLMSQLPAPLFSIYMTRTRPRGSEACFGGIDQSKVKGSSNISWVQVVSETYWTVNMTGVSVDQVIPTEVLAIIDTGTSFIYIPDKIVAAIYQQIPGSKPTDEGFYSYPCDTRAVVSFVLDSMAFTLDPRDFNIGQNPGDLTGRTCIGAIVASGSVLDIDNIAILGDSFLKSYISVFDYSHGGRVGLVKSTNG